jgi:site-specific recombinase XerC
VGVKKPLKQRQTWAIRFFLDREGRMRDRALFDLAIDSKLRGCDLVKIKIGTLVTGQEIRSRAMVVQQKTGRPVQFEITTEVSASLLAWLQRRGGTMAEVQLTDVHRGATYTRRDILVIASPSVDFVTRESKPY